jgi:hypothetical protein
VGSPKTVIEHFRRYAAMGFPTSLVRPIVGDHVAMLDSLRRLGAEVIPELRDD